MVVDPCGPDLGGVVAGVDGEPVGLFGGELALVLFCEGAGLLVGAAGEFGPVVGCDVECFGEGFEWVAAGHGSSVIVTR